MPQYNTHQYGLKQYGRFHVRKESGEAGRWLFMPTRMTVNREAGTITLYQHSQVALRGKPQGLRLQTNQGDRVYTTGKTMAGRPAHIRLRSNTDDILYS